MHPPPTKPTIHADVDLQLVGEKGLSTVDTPLPPVFYVIVGAGPAAVINHSTLIRTDFGDRRLNYSPAGKIPILHIGFSNPWGRYMRHGMGQPPYLLNLPGFRGENQIRADAPMVDGGLDSREFAGAVDRQFTFLRDREKLRWSAARARRFEPLQWPWMKGWVAAVQSRADKAYTIDFGNEEGGTDVQRQIDALKDMEYPNYLDTSIAPYRLIVVRRVEDAWKADLVYAQFIDFCTGTGRPRINIKPDTTPEFKKALTPPWLDPALWTRVIGDRRILSGMDAICEEVVWRADERICVPKGGGIALNAAEKAVHNSCYLDWFNDKLLEDTFVNTRNYTFIKHWSEERARLVGENEPGTTKITGDRVVPHYAKGRLGRGASLQTVLLTSDKSKVEVTLKDEGGAVIIASDRTRATGIENGHWKSTGAGPAPSKEYDRIALAQGLDENGVGQPSWLAGRFTPTAEITFPSDLRMLACGTTDQVIRVLGAAAQVYTPYALAKYKPEEAAATPMANMWAYRATLPLSTVPDGFILSGVNIATANEFFTGLKPNKNLNTMTASEIDQALRKAGIGGAALLDLTRIIVTNRNRANGFASGADLVSKLQAATTGAIPVEEDYVKRKLVPLEKTYKKERDDEYDRLNQDVLTARGTPAETDVNEKVVQLKTFAELKYKDQVRIATEAAHREWAKLNETLTADGETVVRAESTLRTVFSFAYDAIDED